MLKSIESIQSTKFEEILTREFDHDGWYFDNDSYTVYFDDYKIIYTIWSNDSCLVVSYENDELQRKDYYRTIDDMIKGEF